MRGILAMLGQFDAAEMATATNALKGVMVKLGATSQEVSEEAAFQLELARQAAEIIDDLMVARLTADNPTIPLLCPADARRVAGRLLRGTTMDDEAMAASEIIRVAAEHDISTRISLLQVVGTDLYDAFWKRAHALLTVITTHSSGRVVGSGGLIARLTTSPELRAEVIRLYMTPATWRKRTLALTQVLTGATPSATRGAAAVMVDDADQQAYQRLLEAADAEFAPALTEMIQAIQAALRARGREIWPAGSGH